MNFGEIDRHIISMDSFKLKWRFTEEEYDVLPTLHLDQVKALDGEAAKFLADFIDSSALHADMPFKEGFFKFNDATRIQDGNERSIKKWLYQRALPFDKQVYLSWDDETAIKTSWKLVVKYWDSFFYRSSDDLTVFDESLTWSLLFFHAGEIYWGTNVEYEPSIEYDEAWFTN